MREPTHDQRAVLDSTARVRIVRAVPGSGKTWLVAELIRQELGSWKMKGSGIAALSFTRVGGDEIRKALGYELAHPHFVGTIDAFLFRYVVRPFLQKCFPKFAAPRLIPGEWGAEHWRNYGKNQKATIGQGINLFGCVFIDEENGKAVVAHKPHPAQPLQPLKEPEATWVMSAKMKMWERSGRLTHSDAALWASRILGHDRLGAAVRTVLLRRFPLIIVDELQDTGYFLGKSIRWLIQDPSARGVLVGDPDQAIYEFNGARPDLFDRFESIKGGVTLQLSNSLRCAPSVAAAASHLKDSGGSIGPACSSSGRAFLVRYDDMIKDIARIVQTFINPRKGASIKVIARQTSAVLDLIGKNAKQVPRLGCPPLNHMHRAVVRFRQGRHIAALAAVRAALDLAVFDHEDVKDTELEETGIDPDQWKRLAISCLLCAAKEPTSGCLYDWQDRIGHLVDVEIARSELGSESKHIPGKLKTKRKKVSTRPDCGMEPCADYLPEFGETWRGIATIPVQTVHGVKGETHDFIIFVNPVARKAQYCPSTVWWSMDDKAREERRIGYVAMTRSRGDLIVCVSVECYQRLFDSRKAFVQSFECVSVNELIANLGNLDTGEQGCEKRCI